MSEETMFELPERQAKKPIPPTRPEQARTSQPVRSQVEWAARSLDSLLARDHVARVIWAMIERMDLSAFYGSILAVIGGPGRPATDPQVLMALWVLATVQGIGRARHLARMCVEHDAFRWIRGGVPINYHMLSDFRVAKQDEMNDLLTKIVAAMDGEGLVKLDRVAQDGMRVRASAGAGSFHRKESAEKAYAKARELVDQLFQEREHPDPEVTRRQQAARERAAIEREERIINALNRLPEMEAAKERQGKTLDKERRRKVTEPRVSTTDPDARVMKMADGGFRPAYNFEIASTVDGKVIVGVKALTEGSDAGQASPMVEQIEKRIAPSKTAGEQIDHGAEPTEGRDAGQASPTLEQIETGIAPTETAGEQNNHGTEPIEKGAEPVEKDVEQIQTGEEQIDRILEPAVERKAGVPGAYLMDGGCVNLEDITKLEQKGITVYAPPRPPRTATSGRTQFEPTSTDTPEVAAWRARMGTDEAKTIYKQRGATAELVNAHARRYGLQQLTVRGVEKALSVILLVAITHNLMRWVALGG